MKLDPPEPPRVADAGPEPLRDLVHGTRRDAPGSAAMERMSKRLATAGALSKSVAASSPRPALSWASYKLGAVALAVTAGLVFTWQVTLNSTGAPSERGAASSPSLAASGAAEVTTPRPASSDRPERIEAAAVSVDELPSAAPSVGAIAPAVSAKSPIDNTGVKATEFELFQRAQAALPSDPERALALTSEQARAYPSGEFVQEREVIAVEALSRIGQKDESYRRASALLQRFPRTPYAARLEIAVGRRLLVPSPSPSESADRKTRVDAGSSYAIPNP